MFPIIKAIMKSSNLNCEMDRCPINLTKRSKKKKEMMALKIHWIAVRVSWLLKKSTKIHVLISNKGEVMGLLEWAVYSFSRLLHKYYPHWPFGDFIDCFRKIYINITTLKRIVIKNKLI